MHECANATRTFTERELRVLYWLGMGKSNAEIGEVLHLATATIKKHMQQIMDKLGVENRAAAAWYAREFFPGA